MLINIALAGKRTVKVKFPKLVTSARQPEMEFVNIRECKLSDHGNRRRVYIYYSMYEWMLIYNFKKATVNAYFADAHLDESPRPVPIAVAKMVYGNNWTINLPEING